MGLHGQIDILSPSDGIYIGEQAEWGGGNYPPVGVPACLGYWIESHRFKLTFHWLP